MNPMQEALKRRKPGLDLTISVGKPPEDDKNSDLAPSSMPKDMEADPEDGDQSDELKQLADLLKMNPEARLLAQKILDQHASDDAQPSDEMSDLNSADKDVSDSMSDQEKSRLMETKPKSIEERAKQAALSRMKK